jgi:hypothetical protein
MGRDWTLEEIQATINRRPHKSALKPNAIAHVEAKVRDKVAKGQACVVLWDDIKNDHPHQLKVLPVAAIPHKSRAYRWIIDLLFALHLEDGDIIELVNNITEKWAPRGAIDQIGHSLKKIIHAFMCYTAPPSLKLRAKLQQGQQQINCGNKIKFTGRRPSCTNQSYLNGRHKMGQQYSYRTIGIIGTKSQPPPRWHLRGWR